MVAHLIPEAGTSRDELAALLGVHKNTLARKLAGHHAFDEDEIVALAAYFGVPVGLLFEDPAALLGLGTIKMNCGPIRSTLAIAA